MVHRSEAKFWPSHGADSISKVGWTSESSSACEAFGARSGPGALSGASVATAFKSHHVSRRSAGKPAICTRPRHIPAAPSFMGQRRSLSNAAGTRKKARPGQRGGRPYHNKESSDTQRLRNW